MQLQTYISDLLYRYDCVTLPDFGSFVTRQVSAELNSTTKTFFAPKKAILFYALSSKLIKDLKNDFEKKVKF